MKKVDEFFPIDITASIGPSGTIRRVFQNRDYFADRGYKITVFAAFPIDNTKVKRSFELREMTELPEMGGRAKMSQKSKNLLSNIRSFMINNKIATWYYVRNRVLKHYEKHVKRYLSMQRNVDLVVFHDYISAYYFLKHRGDNKAKVSMFLHSDGNNDSMTQEAYPHLKGTNLLKSMHEMFIHAIEKVDGIVFISSLSKQRFMGLHPEIDPFKIFAVVNGIDDKPIISGIRKTDFKYRLCCSGTVCIRKGQHRIVEAMAQIDKEVLKDTHFTIVGSGESLGRIKTFATEHNLLNHITFTGNVPNPEVHKILCEENIFILMSENEGLPIAIIEAMRAGLAVISTRVAGIPEQVNETNGILLSPSVEELIPILNDLPNHDWSQLGKNSRKRYENEFTFGIMRKHYADMFDSVANN